MDSLEQHPKKNNIRISGFRESDNENIPDKINKLFANEWKVQINDDIVAVYGVGQKNNIGRTRHLLVALNEVEWKNTIYRKKKLLNGVSIVIKRDLTVETVKLVKEASEKHGFKNVWTFIGTFLIKTGNGIEKILPNV